MIRLSPVWKLYIFYTLVLIVGMTLAGFFLDHQVKRRLEAHLGEDALSAARIAAFCLPAERRGEALAAYCRRYREASGWRLTLVRKDGSVVGDSDVRPAEMDNHRDRVEIHRALTGGEGTAVRRSPTLGAHMLYGARFDPGLGLVVRVAMPMARVKQIENEVMATAAVFLYFAPLLCALAAFFAARGLVRRPPAPPPGGGRWAR